MWPLTRRPPAGPGREGGAGRGAAEDGGGLSIAFRADGYVGRSAAANRDAHVPRPAADGAILDEFSVAFFLFEGNGARLPAVWASDLDGAWHP